MGKSQRRSAYKPLSQKAIKRIMANNPVQEEEKVEIAAMPVQASIKLTRHMEYDSLSPEETIRQFIAFLTDCRTRYEEDLRLVEQYQLQKQDLDHFIEMNEILDRTTGHKYSRLVRDMWRKRRQCKNEAELLKPVIDFIDYNKEAINNLIMTQGKCRQAKEMIDQREYVVRTNILEGMLQCSDR